MKVRKSTFWLTMTSVVIVACIGQTSSAQDGVEPAPKLESAAPLNRWYSEAQVENGKVLYLNYCAACHKPDASGTTDWKSSGPDGKYPPPPLNGTAHTWHHSKDLLRRTIRRGGVALGGVMPGFEAVLKKNEMDEIIAYFQSTWSDDIYNKWVKMTQ